MEDEAPSLEPQPAGVRDGGHLSLISGAGGSEMEDPSLGVPDGPGARIRQQKHIFTETILQIDSEGEREHFGHS